jgi:hypothetical protein
MKKRIGNLYGKPVVIGDSNEMNEYELLAHDNTPIEVPAPSGDGHWRASVEDILRGAIIEGAEIVWDAIVKAIENKTYTVIFKENYIPDKTILTINSYLNFGGSQDTFAGGLLSLTLLGGIRNGAWGAYNIFVIASNEGGEIIFAPIETGAPA